MTSALIGTLVMGILAVLVLGAVLRSRPWDSYRPHAIQRGDDTTHSGSDVTAARTGSTVVWLTAFLVGAVGAVAAIAALATGSVPPASGLAGPIVVGAAVLVSIHLVLGVYVTARERGHPNSLAAAEMATVCGALFLGAIATQLIGA